MNEFDIWFSIVKLSSRIKLKLIKKLKTTENIWEYCNSKSEYLFSIGKDENKLKSLLKKSWKKDEICDISKKITAFNIQMVDFYSDLYPSQLKNYEDSPSILFYKGNINKLNKNKNVALIGSRKCSSYGENVCQIISRELSINGVNIISGMAKGIDGIGHRIAIENNGYTCAILGCGIDVIYPKENRKLYYNLMEKGCIISEFAPGTPPYSYNFPMRNRIISGISSLVIVVEAGEKSGSLITASCALEQGKDVMAVPGSIFSKTSIGSNKLIKDGAYPLVDIQDIFNLINLNYDSSNNAKNDKLSRIERQVYKIISDSPIHLDDIIRITNIDIKQLYEVLFELQLKNEIICLKGNYYVRIANSI